VLHGAKIIPEAGRDEKATLNLRPAVSNIRTTIFDVQQAASLLMT
jgi:hypothetical protein